MPHAHIPYIERVKNGELEISTLGRYLVAWLLVVGKVLCLYIVTHS